MLIKTIGIILFFVITFFIVYEFSKEKGKPSKPILDFRQTECFGTCPVYSATIYEDGAVEYHGEKHVDVKGHKKFKLSKGAMLDLKNKIKQLDPLELKSEYDGNITDLPSTYITFYLGDNVVKKVRARWQIPKNLFDFIESTNGLILGL